MPVSNAVYPAPRDRFRPSLDGAPRAITRVLVSNRGEIAVRIIESCALLGIETVGIFTDSDAEAPHVALATQSVYIGSSIPDPAAPEALSPYLRGPDIIKLALETGCDAVHPGYGYLSENAAFADQVVAAGLIFIGPASDSIRTIGDKAASKAYLTKHGMASVLVPGYSAADQSLDVLVKAGKSIGYPLLIKASAGGGGKGMRIVHNDAALANEIERAASESKRNFGDARLLLEKYVDSGKHIEIQIFGDRHGNVYSFFERECSVQRRHQKLIEESPSPALSPSQCEKIATAAREIGSLLSYEGAGTVEFIFDTRTGEFFFLEVNTRLQVEHPITEMTTGLDLVALQIFVAAGGNLSTLPQVTGVQQQGHSIEARLCAEDAFADFAPRTGTIRLWVDGMKGIEGTRRDTGINTGSEVTVFFDPMLAKLIVWAPTRIGAINKLKSLLSSSICLGITTNQIFLLNCLSLPSFLDGTYTTAFVPTQIDSILAITNQVFANVDTAKLSTNLAIVASVFLRHIATQENQSSALGRVPADWSLNREDLSRLPLESLEVVLPNTTSVHLKLELPIPPANAPAFSSQAVSYTFRSWTDPEAMPPNKKNGTGAARTALVDNFYRGIASRDGKESREIGDWKLGVKEEAIKTVEAKVASVRIFAENRFGRTWYHGYVRLSLGNLQETFFVATGDYEGTTGVEQTVYVHSSQIGGGVQVKRRNLLTFAGNLDKRVAGAPEPGDGAKYTSQMPCRILEIVAEDGDVVKIGDPLLIMESMKTEIRITAKAAGTVRMLVAEGDICAEGKTLCEVVSAEDDE